MSVVLIPIYTLSLIYSRTHLGEEGKLGSDGFVIVLTLSMRLPPTVDPTCNLEGLDFFKIPFPLGKEN